MSNKIYGLAYHSPLVIYWLISPIDYTPILLIDENPSEIKKTVDEAFKFRKKSFVILAGSISILHSFLKKYGDIKQPCKVILFDFPGLLIPFNIPHIEWLDCDCQSGGAWQITKFKTESFKELLTLLSPITPAIAQSLLKITRYVPKERVPELEQVKKYLPETYKELLAVTSEEVKKVKDKESKAKTKKLIFNDLIKNYLLSLPKKQRRFAMKIVLDYALTEDKNKREFMNILEPIGGSKELLINMRMQIEGEYGCALFKAYVDHIHNAERRSWKTILKDHDLIDEQDLILLLTYSPRSKEVVDMYQGCLEEMAKLPADATPVKTPYPKSKSPKLESLFELDKED